MLQKIFNKILGDPNENEIKKLQPLIDSINQYEESYQSLSEKELKAKTAEFKERIKAGETVDDLLPEAFAVVKNTCRRLIGSTYKIAGQETTWNMIPYDVQLIGGIVLHQGRIAEMKTGEGKTLVCTLPVYLNSLTGKGVHVVTVNDYLAKRDAEWMSLIYNYLGVSVGIIYHGLKNDERRDAYNADVTYGTNNEFGFDYLRDNMVQHKENMVQRVLNYAIVDEVDSILIDEARTPLIISQPAEESTNKYHQYASLIPRLVENEDYNVDEKLKTATLTENGIAKMETFLGMDNIYTEAGFTEVHHIEQALKAYTLFKIDRDYIVKDGEVIIVDEFTGRLMPGRRYSEGLHQSIEAKENVEVKRESKTLATITFQNYFRIYKKLAGMTGTAVTEAEEFSSIYNLETLVIPTNKPITRKDLSDNVYKNEKGKFQAIVRTIKEKYEKGQPVLVGTISIEKSEILSDLLKKAKVPHRVLNAKHHEKEAEIISRAGQSSAVTIATNMAGRGTDIKLGENVIEAGGLSILGSERHESRRIDNQLRGRAGRQGDIGESQFYVSLEDDLMRLFGSERVQKIMDTIGVPDDQPLNNAMVSRSIESAQKKVEGHNFDIRKHLVEYDDIMNKHREIVYKKRQNILFSDSIHQEMITMIQSEITNIIDSHISVKNQEIDIEEIAETVYAIHKFNENPLNQLSEKEQKNPTTIKNHLIQTYLDEYQLKSNEATSQESFFQIEKAIYLRTIDVLWMDHIQNMSKLRESVALRGYAQRDPLLEYKSEAYAAFQKLMGNIQTHTVNTIYKVKLNIPENNLIIKRRIIPTTVTNKNNIQAQSTGSITHKKINHSISNNSEIKRNDSCPCGSGKKYKKCCGK